MLATTGAAIGVVAIVSRFVLPVLFRLVAKSGRREAFPLAVVLASIGTAWASSLLGISMALGAFLGGLVLAESEYSHQAYAEIRPLRDILAGLFFISLGMLVDPSILLGQFPLIIAIAILLVFVKASVATGAFLVAATTMRVAATAALIWRRSANSRSSWAGRDWRSALTPSQWQLLLASSIATMVVTPALLGVAPAIGSWMATKVKGHIRLRPNRSSQTSRTTSSSSASAWVAAAGRALRQLATPYVILDLNGATVRQARKEGESIFFGDATNEDALRAAGVARAKAVVGVLSDLYAAARALTAIRTINDSVPIILRMRYKSEAETAMRQGATVAVAEEMEASLEVLAQTFARLDVRAT